MSAEAEGKIDIQRVVVTGRVSVTFHAGHFPSSLNFLSLQRMLRVELHMLKIIISQKVLHVLLVSCVLSQLLAYLMLCF